MTFEQWWQENKEDLFAAALGARTHSDTIDESGEQMLRNEMARAWNAGVDATVDPSNHLADLYATWPLNSERP